MVKKEKHNSVDLKKIFLGLQTEMVAKLRNTRANVGHPTAKGNVTESSWRGLLEKYLPKRYAVESAFVVDSKGNISDQIDLVIFDRHFSPFLFHQEGAVYIPAESVYAVFEIKQEATKKNILYAGQKAESVRILKRTSTHVAHAGGKFDPVKPKEIIAGFLSLTGGGKFGLSSGFPRLIRSVSGLRRIDLGCILECGAFDVIPHGKRRRDVHIFPADQALIQFFLALLSKLQAAGSVPAIDIQAYRASLSRLSKN